MKFQDHIKSGRHRAAMLRIGLFAIVFAVLGLGAFACGAAIGSGAFEPGHLLAAGVLLPMGRLFKDASENEAGSGFEGKVLSAVERIQKQNEEFGKNFDSLSKETKTAIEDLRRARDADHNNIESFQLALKKVQLSMARETRMALGSPAQRISGDPEMREAFNAFVRQACEAPMTEAHRKALVDTSTPGSTYINSALAPEVYDSLARYGAWSSLGVRQVGTKTTKFPVKTARPVAYFLNTSRTIGEDSTKAGTSVDCNILPIGVLLSVARELIDDAEIDVTADVLDDFTQAIAYRLDWAAFQADGTADNTDGGMTGMFGGGGTAVGAASGNTTVETLDFEDLVNVIVGVDAEVLNRAAKWWIHPQMLARLLKVKDSNGRSIFLTANEAPSYGGIGSILGYPVVPTMAAPTTNSASAKVALFGDPQALVVGVSTAFQFEGSDHAGFTTFDRAFRGIARGGAVVRKATALGVLTLAAS
jgi:HK97 family phage major capsid protein